MNARLDTPLECWGVFGELSDDMSLIPGMLHYDPNSGISVDLVGRKGLDDSAPLDDLPSFSTLHGVLVDGTHVTFFNCQVTQTSIGAGVAGLPTTVVAESALFGTHVTDLADLHLTCYAIEFSSLSNWMGKYPLSVHYPEENGKRLGVDLKYRPLDSIDVRLADQPFDLCLSAVCRTQQDKGVGRIHWGSQVKIKANDTLTMDSCRDIGWQCQNLLALLIGHRISVKAVQITIHQEENTTAQIPITLLYRQAGNHDEPHVHTQQMILPYSRIGPSFANMVSQWFNLSAQAKLATNVYFSSETLPSPSIEVRFLAIVQAAESYHRSLESGIYMDQREYDEIVLSLVNSIPAGIKGDHRHSLKNRLKYGNEHSLRKRLRALLDRVPRGLQERIAPDASKFIQRIVETRNYLTHYDGNVRENALPAQDLFVAIGRLRIIVLANLLQDLGVGEDEISVALYDNK